MLAVIFAKICYNYYSANFKVLNLLLMEPSTFWTGYMVQWVRHLTHKPGGNLSLIHMKVKGESQLLSSSDRYICTYTHRDITHTDTTHTSTHKYTHTFYIYTYTHFTLYLHTHMHACTFFKRTYLICVCI